MQKFRVRWNEARTHVMLTNVRFNRALDVSGAGTESGTPVQGYTPNETPAQWWRVITDGGDHLPEQARPIELEPLCAPGKRLDVAGGSCECGATLNIHGTNGTPAQKWAILDQGGRVWELVNNGSGSKLAIDMPW